MYKYVVHELYIIIVLFIAPRFCTLTKYVFTVYTFVTFAHYCLKLNCWLTLDLYRYRYRCVIPLKMSSADLRLLLIKCFTMFDGLVFMD